MLYPDVSNVSAFMRHVKICIEMSSSLPGAFNIPGGLTPCAISDGLGNTIVGINILLSDTNAHEITRSCPRQVIEIRSSTSFAPRQLRWVLGVEYAWHLRRVKRVRTTVSCSDYYEFGDLGFDTITVM